MTFGNYPLVAFYDENGKPIKLAETGVLSLSSLSVGTISATNYLNLSGVSVSGGGSGIVYPVDPSGSTSAGVWTVSALDARYVNVSGDTMQGTLTVPAVAFPANPVPAITVAEGIATWNDVHKTLEVGTANQTSYFLGQEVSIRVRNNTGAPVNKGTVVFVSGYASNIIEFGVANNTSEVQTHKGLGVLKQTLGQGNRGLMTLYGIVEGTADDNLNTNAFNVGDVVYLSTNGQITTTYAAAPSHPEIIGSIIVKSSTLGSIFVHIQHGYELKEIHDVSRTAATQGQVLTWQTDQWVPSNHGSIAGIYTQDAHPQYAITSAADFNQVLYRGPGGLASGIVTPTNTNTFLKATVVGGNVSYGWASATTGGSYTENPTTATEVGVWSRINGLDNYYMHLSATDPVEIVYRDRFGTTSSVNVTNADSGKYLKYASATSSYVWDNPISIIPTDPVGTNDAGLWRYSSLSSNLNTFFALDTDATAISAAVSSLGLSSVTISSTVAALQASSFTISSTLNRLQASSVTISSTVANLQGSSFTISSTLDRLQASSTTISSTLSNLQGSSFTISASVTALQTSASNLQASSFTISSTLNNLQASSTTISSTLSNLQASSFTISSTVNRLQASSFTISSTVANLQSSSFTISSTLDRLQASSTTISSTLSNLQGSSFTISSTLAGHVTSAVHWTLADLNSNYLNSSGDVVQGPLVVSGLLSSMNIVVFASSVTFSAATQGLSATNIKSYLTTNAGVSAPLYTTVGYKHGDLAAGTEVPVLTYLNQLDGLLYQHRQNEVNLSATPSATGHWSLSSLSGALAPLIGGTGGVTALSGITSDVQLPNASRALANGDVLIWFGSERKWKNQKMGFVPPATAIAGSTGAIIVYDTDTSAYELSDYDVLLLADHVNGWNNIDGTNIHWYASTLDARYANVSGDTFTGSVSAPQISSVSSNVFYKLVIGSSISSVNSNINPGIYFRARSTENAPPYIYNGSDDVLRIVPDYGLGKRVRIGGDENIYYTFDNSRFGIKYGTGLAYLTVDANETFAQRNGTNAQAFRIYNTYTDVSSYERAGLNWNSNRFEIETEASGAGVSRDLVIGTSGTPRMVFSGTGARIDTSGMFVAGTIYPSNQTLYAIRNASNRIEFFAGASVFFSIDSQGDTKTIANGKLGWVNGSNAGADPDTWFSRTSVGLIRATSSIEALSSITAANRMATPALSATNISGVTTLSATNVTGTNIYGTSAYITNLSATNLYGNTLSKSISIINPSSTENVTLFYTSEDHTITKMTCVLRGSSPSALWTVRKDPSRAGTGTEVVTGGTASTSTTTGSIVTSFNSSTIPNSNFVWLQINGTTGTVNEYHLTIEYKKTLGIGGV